jgi:hypothetical protein
MRSILTFIPRRWPSAHNKRTWRVTPRDYPLLQAVTRQQHLLAKGISP